jgi:hypothetical protein
LLSSSSSSSSNAWKFGFHVHDAVGVILEANVLGEYEMEMDCKETGCDCEPF